MIPLCQSESQTDAMTAEGVDWGPTRAKTIEWHDHSNIFVLTW